MGWAYSALRKESMKGGFNKAVKLKGLKKVPVGYILAIFATGRDKAMESITG